MTQPGKATPRAELGKSKLGVINRDWSSRRGTCGSRDALTPHGPSLGTAASPKSQEVTPKERVLLQTVPVRSFRGTGLVPLRKFGGFKDFVAVEREESQICLYKQPLGDKNQH